MKEPKLAISKQQGEDHVPRFFSSIEEWLPAHNVYPQRSFNPVCSPWLERAALNVGPGQHQAAL